MEQPGITSHGKIEGWTGLTDQQCARKQNGSDEKKKIVGYWHKCSSVLFRNLHLFSMLRVTIMCTTECLIKC